MRSLRTAVLALSVLALASSCFGTRNAQRAPGTRYAAFETGPIFYDDVGEDEPTALILVHGWSCDMSVWEQNLGELSASIRTIAMDLPGHGESRGPLRGYSIDYLARSIDAVFESAGLERAILVAHDTGVPVIRRYYRDHPEKVAGMIVVEGALDAPMRAAAIQGLVRDMQSKDSRRAITEYVEGLLLEDMPADERSRIVDTILSTPRTVMIDSLRSTSDPELYGDDPIDVPLLLVLSENEPAWSRAYETFVRSIAPSVEIRKVRGAGHFVMIDQPERFDGAVVDFLDDAGLLPPPEPVKKRR